MTLERTQIKFALSAAMGDLIGFVSRHSKTHQLRGVREDSRFKKKICVLSEELKGSIIPDILYIVELKPMHTGNGYVVVSAVRRLFPATVETEVIPRKNIYRVLVHFGNKTVIFDPLRGKSNSSRTATGVITHLRDRTDIESCEEVIDNFREQASQLLHLMAAQGVIDAELPGL